MSMQSITTKQMYEVIQHNVMRMNEVCFFWGSAGIGKTDTGRHAVESLGAHFWDFRPGQHESVDFRGLPNFKTVDDVEMAVWSMPDLLPFEGNPKAPTDRPIGLFADEFNGSTSNPVFTMLMQLFNERMVAGRKLLPNVRIFAAGNREGDKGTATRTPFTVNNRGTHFEIVSCVDTWSEWAASVGVPPVIIAFLQFRKPLLNMFDPTKNEKVVATPRTWAKAVNYYADSQLPRWLRDASIAGCVGAGPAAELFAFEKIWETLKDYMPRIRREPTTVELPSGEQALGTTYALAVAISGEMSAANISTFHSFLCRLSPEFAILAWQMATAREERMVKDNQLRPDQSLFTTKEFIDFSKKFKAVFN